LLRPSDRGIIPHFPANLSRNAAMPDPFRQDGFFKTLLDKMQIGIIVADSHGIVRYINETYARFLGIDIEASLGLHARDIVANSRLHEVAASGQAEINYPHRFKDTSYLVHRIPIRDGARVIAVMGLVLFDGATTAVKLAEKLVYLESKLKAAQNELAAIHAARYRFADIVAASPEMVGLKREAAKAARSDLSVLITGESGTGKELFAQAIHHESARCSYPFVRVNCAAIPRELFESELFGYDRGAFSGANPKGKAGKFELAHLGTIFLDEVGDLPLDLQPKLLRVLEEREFERIGGNRMFTSDFRVVAATNHDLERAMAEGEFRRDLYFRLNGVPLHIPPLRFRRADIVSLAEHFLKRIAVECGKKNLRLDREAMSCLQACPWPGNGRELLHVLERASFNSVGTSITATDLPVHGVPPQSPSRQVLRTESLRQQVSAAERQAIEAALIHSQNNKTVAARMLGIHRTLLYRKMKQLGLCDPPQAKRVRQDDKGVGG
jgi:PAS domain S-box-containing protein